MVPGSNQRSTLLQKHDGNCMNCWSSVVAPLTFVVPQYWSPARLYSTASQELIAEPEPLAEKYGLGLRTVVLVRMFVVANPPHVLQPPRFAGSVGGVAVVV